MNIHTRTFLLGLSAVAVGASLAQTADLQPLVVGNFTGQLHIHQNIPCGSVDRTTPVVAGRVELAPAEGLDVPGGKQFILTRAQASFASVSIPGSCAGFSETRTYTAISAYLDRAVSFVAAPVAAGVYSVVIPKDDV